MKKILCATRGGEASRKTQDAVIAMAKEEGAKVLFLYIISLLVSPNPMDAFDINP